MKDALMPSDPFQGSSWHQVGGGGGGGGGEQILRKGRRVPLRGGGHSFV